MFKCLETLHKHIKINYRKVLIVITFFLLIIVVYKLVVIEGVFTGKNGQSEKFSLEKNNQEINLFISQFRGEYLSSALNIENRSLIGEGTEGGEIVRYMENNGNVLRYRLTYYGEVGRIEENYYIIKRNNIYYTKVEEIYSSSINLKLETDILYRIFSAGMIINDEVCYYEKSNIVLEEIGSTENIYKSLEELDALYDSMEFGGRES